MTINFSRANASRNHVARHTAFASQEVILDATVFLDFVDPQVQPGVTAGELELYEKRFFRPTGKSHGRPAGTPSPEQSRGPSNPLETEEYVSRSVNLSRAYDNLAEGYSKEAGDANLQSDNYILLTVLFSIVLLLEGISSKFRNQAIG